MKTFLSSPFFEFIRFHNFRIMKMELGYGSVQVKSERLEESRSEDVGAYCLNPVVNDRRICSNSSSYEFARNRSQAIH